MPEKVLIAIMSAGGREDYRKILRTRCLQRLPPWCRYVFFVGKDFTVTTEAEDVVSVDAGDGYLDLSEKVLKFFQHALQHFDFRYMLKCDDNTLIFPSQLERILRDDPGYAGNVVTPSWFNRSWHYRKLRSGEPFGLYDIPYIAPYVQGGPGYIIKREHVETVVAAASTIDTTREFYEDKMVGDCLFKTGISPMHRKADFVIRGHWQPSRIPLTLKCSSVQEMDRYSRIAAAPPAARRAFALLRRIIKRTKRTLMNRGYVANPDARGEGGFIVCRKKRFLAVNIPKNGSRSLLSAVFEHDVGGEAPADIYGHFGYKIDGKHRVHIGEGGSDEFHGYVKFAVWRDPVERMVSLYRDKVAEMVSEEFQSYFLERGIVGSSFDDFLTFIEDEFRKPTAEIDEHVRRQIDFYQPSDVDWIVPLTRLSAFMEKELGVLPKMEADPPRTVSIQDPSPGQVKRIIRLYAEDFYLFNETKVYNGDQR